MANMLVAESPASRSQERARGSRAWIPTRRVNHPPPRFGSGGQDASVRRMRPVIQNVQWADAQEESQMRWSLRIARIADIEVKIHLTFLLLLVWIAVIYFVQGGPVAARDGLIFILLLFVSIVLHEFGHALTARRYGVATRDITLLPIGGVARLERMPEDPKEELVIAIAGPAVNVGIVLLLLIVAGPMTGAGASLQLMDARAGILDRLFWANIIIVLFNLIPAFPMDGGRVLRAILALRMEYVRATQIAARIGQGLAFVFGFIGLFFNPLLIFIALFVYLAATQEAATAEMKDLAERLPVSAAMVSHAQSLRHDASLAEAVEALWRTLQHAFPVIDERGRLPGLLTREDLIEGLRKGGPTTPVRQVMRIDIPSVLPTHPRSAAFQRMQECRCPALPVVDDEGRLTGIITPEDVGELVMIHGALRGEQHPSWWPADRVGSARTDPASA